VEQSGIFYILCYALLNFNIMKNRLTETIYQNEHYMIPYDMMGSWFAFMKDLSVFERDCGDLQIQFGDKFRKFKVANN